MLRVTDACTLLQLLMSASQYIGCRVSCRQFWLTGITIPVFTGLRTYALCGRRVWVLCLVSGLAGVPFIANLVGLTFIYIPSEFFSLTLPFADTGLVRDGPSYVCAPISFRSLRSSVSFLRDSAYMVCSHSCLTFYFWLVEVNDQH